MTQAPAAGATATVARPLSVWIEVWWPTVAGVCGAASAAMWGSAVEGLTASRGWAFSELYGGIFNFSAIAVGGLMAAYALLLTDTTETLRHLRRTRTLSRFLAFVRYAIGTSLLLSVWSLPMLVVKPSFRSGELVQLLLACVWTGLVFALIAGVIRIFATIRALTETT